VKESIKLAEPTKVEAKAHEWLSKHNGKPFFLFLHYYDVHSDYHSLPRYEKQFVRPYQGIADGSTLQLLLFRKNLEKRFHFFSLDDNDVKHLIDLYDAGIRQMDDGMARLFALLEKKDMLDNTLIIVTSDHGEEFMEHGGVLHGRTQFQELIHVPLLIRGPGLPHSKRLRHIASLVDVMPTILALQGISPPASLDGINLCPLWQKSNAQLPQRYIFAEADHNNTIHDVKRAIRHQRYKLHYDRSSKETQLYDLFDDPQEKVDVAHKHTQLVDSMFSSLKDFININKTGRKLEPLAPEEIKNLKSLGYL
jgi:arylsulfatase A-like enzyme